VCLESFLSNCFYRPLIIGITDNGSTDATKEWLGGLSENGYLGYGIQLRHQSFETDQGCAAGTNASCELVMDCEFSLHIESDFAMVPPSVSGEDRLWLNRSVDFLQEVGGDFLYLRRMTDEFEMQMHWWSQWMGRIDQENGKYLRCPKFWWSNNPALFRTEALYRNGTLPLDVRMDGPKGTEGWSRPELSAKAPGNAWIHRWGLFIHEMHKRTCLGMDLNANGCGRFGSGCGVSSCKYGFLKDWTGVFCQECNTDDYRGMAEHDRRYRIRQGA
jgi:hypothetical protein